MTALAAAPLCAGPQALVCGGVLLVLTAGAAVYGVMNTPSQISTADQAADNDLAEPLRQHAPQAIVLVREQ